MQKGQIKSLKETIIVKRFLFYLNKDNINVLFPEKNLLKELNIKARKTKNV